MKNNIIICQLPTLALIAALWAGVTLPSRAVDIRGAVENPNTLMRWHRVSLTFDGPATSEAAEPNPCFQYRLDVTFRGPGGQTMTVPGFFAADGHAGRTGATRGNKWRVYFSPDEVGQWHWKVSFRQGEDVAIAHDSRVGQPWKPLESVEAKSCRT